MQQEYIYTLLPEPITITEQVWPEGTLPLVCTSTLAYNHEPYIRECLDGILMQKTTFPVQVLVHEDCSTDKTEEILKEYQSKYPNLIKVFYQPENVYSLKDQEEKRKRREEFNSWRTGKYIALCEGDDYWIDPLKLQKQVDFLEANEEYSMCFHNSYILNSEYNRFIGKHKIYKYSQDAVLEHILRDGGFIPTQSILMRKSCLSGYDSFPSNCPVGDLMLQTFLALNGKIYYMNEIMAVYRKWEMSSTSIVINDTKKYINHHKKFIEWYKSLDEYLNKKYNIEIEKSIVFSNARIAIAEKDFKQLKNPLYKDFIAYKSLLPRIGLYVKMYGFGWLFPIGFKVVSIVRKFINLKHILVF